MVDPDWLEDNVSPEHRAKFANKAWVYWLAAGLIAGFTITFWFFGKH